MIVATTEKIAGYTIKEHLGTVIGNTLEHDTLVRTYRQPFEQYWVVKLKNTHR